QVAQRDGELGGGEGEGSRRGARIGVLPAKRDRRLPVRDDPGRERDAGKASRREADALPQTQDRIEGRPGGSGQGPAVQRERILRSASPPDEPRPIGLPFHRALAPALQAQDVNGPCAGLIGGSPPSSTQERGRFGKAL